MLKINLHIHKNLKYASWCHLKSVGNWWVPVDNSRIIGKSQTFMRKVEL